MSVSNELASWSWILKIWLILYPVIVIVGIIIGLYSNPAYYWITTILGVPLVVVPATYRNLVGGGCSLRFHICALVKGMLAGFVFLALSMIANILVWQYIGASIGFNPMTLEISQDINLIWLLSGTAGGFGARIVEVRGQSRVTDIKITALE